jgi:hypothetical protein
MINFNKELKVNKLVIEKETNEFLKLMKHNEYCIVDQLHKTPQPKSLLYLLYLALSRT